MKKFFIFILVIAAIIFGVVFFSKNTMQQNTNSAPVETINTQSSQNTSSSTSQIVNISIENFAFSQGTVTINKGDTIVWKNIDKVPHQIEGVALKDLKGPVMGYGLTYSFTFNEVGTYDYFCAIHPMMKGKIIVK